MARVERPERILWRPDEVEDFDEELQSIIWIQNSLKELSSISPSTRTVKLITDLEMALGCVNESEFVSARERVLALPDITKLTVEHRKSENELRESAHWNRVYLERLRKSESFQWWVKTICLIQFIVILVTSYVAVSHTCPEPKINSPILKKK